MAATNTLTTTLQFVSPWVNYFPLTLGASQQPFIGMCERVAQVILAPPFKPNFNRNAVNFVTTPGTQTYLNAGSWAISTVYALGTVIIDPYGNGQVVITAGTSGGTAPAWSVSLFTSTTDNTVTWQSIGALGAIPAINDFGYIEKAMVQDVLSGSTWKELGISLNLPRDTTPACPKFIAAQSDDNAGDIGIRLTPTPVTAYPVSIQYQRLHAPFTSLSNSWAPIPDYLFYAYSFGVLALAFLYKSDSRYQWASQQFIALVLAYFDGLSQTQINQFLQAWDATLVETSRMQTSSQGISARGV
jgi:hypothetical protein